MELCDAVLDEKKQEVQAAEERLLGGGREGGTGVQIVGTQLGKVTVECGVVGLADRGPDCEFQDFACEGCGVRGLVGWLAVGEVGVCDVRARASWAWALGEG